jgi:hypothetical protein
VLDRAACTPTPSAAPPLTRIRAGSRDDAMRVRATPQALLLTWARQSEYLEALVEAARAKGVHLLLEDAHGAPFPSWEAFCLERQPWGLGIPAEAVELIIKERSDPRAQARRVLADEAPGRLRLGRQSHRRAARDLAGTKGPRPGTGKDYLLARLARDHRPVLEALERGEYPSVVAAARAAGILTKIVQLRPTPESYARSALATLDAAQLGRLVHYLTHPQDVPSAQARPGNQAGRGCQWHTAPPLSA